MLYAQSGAGKTSLLNAGLAPVLKKKGVELPPIARVGLPVPQTVALDHVRNVYTFSVIGDLLPDLPNRESWVQTATLADALAQIPRAKDEAGEPVLRALAFDQFEELFSNYPQRWQDCSEFFHQVAEALRKDGFLRVLFVLREDALAAFGEFAGLLPEGARTRYHLERLRAPEALLAITRPLEDTRWSYTDGVADALVSDLMVVTVETPSGEVVSVPGEFVEPVQLQVVCYNLIERLPPTSTAITKEALSTFGNPDAALRWFYENAITAAVNTGGLNEGELRSWFETHLITPVGTRGLVFRGRDRTGGISNQAVDLLEAQHLIRPDVRAGSRWYELTHDRFIRPIQQSNLQWKSEQWSSVLTPSFKGGLVGGLIGGALAGLLIGTVYYQMLTAGGANPRPALIPLTAIYAVLVGAVVGACSQLGILGCRYLAAEKGYPAGLANDVIGGATGGVPVGALAGWFVEHFGYSGASPVALPLLVGGTLFGTIFVTLGALLYHYHGPVQNLKRAALISCFITPFLSSIALAIMAVLKLRDLNPFGLSGAPAGAILEWVIGLFMGLQIGLTLWGVPWMGRIKAFARALVQRFWPRIPAS